MNRPSVETMLLRWGLVKRVRAISGDDTALPKASDLAAIDPSTPGSAPTGSKTLEGILLDAADIDSAIKAAKAPLLERLLWDKYVWGVEEVELSEEVNLPKSGETMHLPTGRSTYQVTFDIRSWSKRDDMEEVQKAAKAFGLAPWMIADRALRIFQWELCRSKGWSKESKKSA